MPAATVAIDEHGGDRLGRGRVEHRRVECEFLVGGDVPLVVEEWRTYSSAYDALDVTPA